MNVSSPNDSPGLKCADQILEPDTAWQGGLVMDVWSFVTALTEGSPLTCLPTQC
jgi:hypothetical protein